MTGELTFFEIGVVDAAPARAFYGGLFGWRIEPGPSAGGYRISTPTISGGMHGGDETLESRTDEPREGPSDATRSAATIRAPPSGSTNRPRRRAKVLESLPPASRQ